ncbi:MAG: hypothetical protein HQK49_19920 [Oligoflexia bacterium]|nr:hypothetical protein [Oligoflexia bacterium]
MKKIFFFLYFFINLFNFTSLWASEEEQNTNKDIFFFESLLKETTTPINPEEFKNKDIFSSEFCEKFPNLINQMKRKLNEIKQSDLTLINNQDLICGKKIAFDKLYGQIKSIATKDLTNINSPLKKNHLFKWIEKNLNDSSSSEEMFHLISSKGIGYNKKISDPTDLDNKYIIIDSILSTGKITFDQYWEGLKNNNLNYNNSSDNFNNTMNELKLKENMYYNDTMPGFDPNGWAKFKNSIKEYYEFSKPKLENKISTSNNFTKYPKEIWNELVKRPREFNEKITEKNKESLINMKNKMCEYATLLNKTKITDFELTQLNEINHYYPFYSKELNNFCNSKMLLDSFSKTDIINRNNKLIIKINNEDEITIDYPLKQSKLEKQKGLNFERNLQEYRGCLNSLSNGKQWDYGKSIKCSAIKDEMYNTIMDHLVILGNKTPALNAQQYLENLNVERKKILDLLSLKNNDIENYNKLYDKYKSESEKIIKKNEELDKKRIELEKYNISLNESSNETETNKKVIKEELNKLSNKNDLVNKQASALIKDDEKKVELSKVFTKLKQDNDMLNKETAKLNEDIKELNHYTSQQKEKVRELKEKKRKESLMKL